MQDFGCHGSLQSIKGTLPGFSTGRKKKNTISKGSPVHHWDIYGERSLNEGWTLFHNRCMLLVTNLLSTVESMYTFSLNSKSSWAATSASTPASPNKDSTIPSFYLGNNTFTTQITCTVTQNYTGFCQVVSWLLRPKMLHFAAAFFKICNAIFCFMLFCVENFLIWQNCNCTVFYSDVCW